MGIEELIGFLVGVACGGLLRYLRGENGTQAAVYDALSARQPESHTQSAGAITESSELVSSPTLAPTEQGVSPMAAATEASLARQSELGEQTPTPAAVATESLPASPEVEEKKADLKTAILEILRASGEGLTLSAIAEKLKRHFASIIGPVRLLIEEGLIEKQDKIYKIRGPA
jgi:DNA-binding NarL/FixJ family response regulator